jgi:hypothetical protein
VSAEAGHPGTAGHDAADVAGHALLVRLAGRLPDRLLWRLREWLAGDAHEAVAAMLPRALLRHRVGLTDEERDLLETAVGERGASRRVLDAISALPAPDGPDATFRPGPEPDVAALSVLAVVRGDAGCVELRQAVRAGGPHAHRVVLVRTRGSRPWVLAGTLARVLRAHGDPAPCVEVLPADGAPSAYHRAALDGSALLWHRPAPRATTPGR